MESSQSLVGPENEVRKLQALVKKLEKQNELLRSKQTSDSLTNGDQHDDHHVGKTSSNASHTAHGNREHVHPPPDSVKHKVSEGGLEDVDVLDVDNLSLKDEEDCWLYSSPKPLTPQQSTINLYKWVRQDFDHPSPELETARRSLLSKLDEVARLNRSCSSPTLASTMPPAKSLSPLSRSTEDSRKYYSHYSEDSPKRSSSPHHRHSMLPVTGSRLENTGNHIENGTFVRRKKSVEQIRSANGEREKSDELPYHMHEGTDVEKLARQQEESLRQSMATYTSPKRVSHKSISMASDTDNSGSPAGSSRSSPGCFDYEGSFLSRHRNSLGSDCSTPPDSPSVSQQHSTSYSDQAHTGRSMTGASRLQHPPPSTHSSNSSLEHQSADSTDDLQFAYDTRTNSHLPSTGFRSASPAANGLRASLANSQGLSPQRSCLPMPRRGIPRPSVPSTVRSSLPRRSGIPSHRPISAPARDESWRDGCF